MKIIQLSVFLENKPGQLIAPCRALADARISILTLSLADTQRFGILRLIVPDHKHAKEVLESAGCVVRETEVLAVEVPDRAGGLLEILQAVDGKNINLEYMYAFSRHTGATALLVLRFDDPDRAIEVLQHGGLNVLEAAAVLGIKEES